MSDSWVVNLADGSTKVEVWKPGELSPWQRVMEYCRVNHTYITALRLTIGTETHACPSNAVGYWQAHGMPSVQGVECDEELHKWRGIGWVEDDMVHIIWGARDPQTHELAWWRDSRPARNQAQIVWAKPMFATGGVIQRGDAPVVGLNGYQDKIVEDADGLKEPAPHSH